MLRRRPLGPRRSRHPRRRRRRLLRRILQGRARLVVPGRGRHFADCVSSARHDSFAQKLWSLIQSRLVSMGPSSLLRKLSKPLRPTSGGTIVSPPLVPVGKDRRRRGRPQLRRRRLTRLPLMLRLSLVLLLSRYSSRRPWRGGPYRDEKSKVSRAPISNKWRQRS